MFELGGNEWYEKRRIVDSDTNLCEETVQDQESKTYR